MNSDTSSPLVSVIIPTHNREAVLPRAIHSALTQTYRNIEVIVVDDASTDNTKSLVGAISDSRVRLLTHPDNRGACAARNTGIKASHGEYIAMLDSDDEWLPDKLAVQISALRNGNHHFSYCQFYWPSDSGDTLTLPQQPFRGGSLLEYMFCDGGSVATPGLVIHRSIRVFFDENLPMAQECDWAMQVYRITQDWVFIPKPLFVVHRDDPVRISVHNPPLFLKMKPFEDKYHKEFEANPRAKRALILRYAAHALSRNERRLARSLLWRHRAFPSFTCKPKGLRLWLRAFLRLGKD